MRVSAVSFRIRSILLAIRCVASNHSIILFSKRVSWHLDFSVCLYLVLPFTITPHCDHLSIRGCKGLSHTLWLVSVHFLITPRVTLHLTIGSFSRGHLVTAFKDKETSLSSVSWSHRRSYCFTKSLNWSWCFQKLWACFTDRNPSFLTGLPG